MLPARQLTSSAFTSRVSDFTVADSSDKEPKADSKSGETRPPGNTIKTQSEREDRTAEPSPLPKTNPGVAGLAEARALIELLNVGSYTEMGHAEAGARSRLEELDARLQTALAAPRLLEKDTRRGTTGREAAFAFAQAFRLSALYPDTVGAGDDVIATLPVPTFSCVRPARTDPARHAAAFRSLCQRIGLDDADRASIEAEAENAARKLARRHAVVELLRGLLRPDPDRAPTSADAHRFFGFLFPDHPLQLGEVEVVATQSCVYFCILSQRSSSRGRKHSLRVTRRRVNRRQNI